jgi:putative endonuclease
MRGHVLQWVLRSLDGAAEALPWRRGRLGARHLRTGRRGEDDAYFWLRRQGYVMVARNWRSPRRRGEVDLIGWEAETLCFIEVKTRSRHDLVTAEAAVDVSKQRELQEMGAEYLRRLRGPAPAFRFDVVTVYYESNDRPAITLLRNAFPNAG